MATTLFAAKACLSCVLKPTRKPVPSKLMMLPKVYSRAKLVGLLHRKKEKKLMTQPRPTQAMKPMILCLRVSPQPEGGGEGRRRGRDEGEMVTFGREARQSWGRKWVPWQ